LVDEGQAAMADVYGLNLPFFIRTGRHDDKSTLWDHETLLLPVFACRSNVVQDVGRAPVFFFII
jgi:hypothetical protein